MGGLGDFFEEYRKLADSCGFLSVTSCDLTADRCWVKSSSLFSSSSSEDSSNLCNDADSSSNFFTCPSRVSGSFIRLAVL
jgi:hypothetical protein